MAVTGLARIKMMDGDLKGARLMLQSQLARTATPDLAIAVGDLSSAIGEATTADQYYQMAEQIERAAWGNGLQAAAGARQDPERAAGHGRRKRSRSPKKRRATRADIVTMDTLAWAYFKNGQLAEARKASEQALRTGTRNARIRCHAQTIAEHPPATAALLLRRVHPAPFVTALNGVLDHLLGFFVGLAFDARVQVDVDDPRADRLEVRLLLIGRQRPSARRSPSSDA